LPRRPPPRAVRGLHRGRQRVRRVHQYFKDSQVPLLAVWGANDEIFGPDGARAFARDLPDAEIHLVDSGHFALESHLEIIAAHIRDFLAETEIL
ncbi:alpha/beta fold hydrolase, partial [Streptomyces sp. NPDC005921]